MKRILVSAAVVISLAAFSAGAVAGTSTCGKNCCSKEAAAAKDPTKQDVVLDPVCGMDIKVSEAKYSTKYDGKTYYFCSKSCQKAFERKPSDYIGKKPKK